MEKTYKDPLPGNNQQQLELADIFRYYGEHYRRSKPLSYEKIKVMRHIESCRTADLGGHVQQCDQCGFEQIAYNSCRDRHCPKCQCLVKEQWLNAATFISSSPCRMTLIPLYYAIKKSHCKPYFTLSVKPFSLLPKIPNGDLKANSDSLLYSIPGLRP